MSPLSESLRGLNFRRLKVIHKAVRDGKPGLKVFLGSRIPRVGQVQNKSCQDVKYM